MTVMNLSLPEELKAFVDAQVEKAGFTTPEEYVRALLDEAREREDHRRDVRAKLLEAVEDDPIPMSDDEWDQVRANADRRALARWENEGGALAIQGR